MVNSIKSAANYRQLNMLSHNVTEGMYTILSSFAESVESNLKEDKELLATLTNDRSSLMERIRKEYFSNEEFSNQEATTNLLQITDLYQRSIWLVNRLVSE